MLGSRAIYHDGWKAVTYHPVGPLYDDGLRANAPFDDDVWELYHVAEDVSEVHDRAAEFPDKVAELVALWWEEARRNDVLPLDNRVLEVIAHKHDRRRHQETYRYFQGGAQVPEWVAVDVRNRSHAMSVTVEVPTASSLGHASRARLRARRLVASPPRRATALRPQPARAAAVRGRRRHRSRVGPSSPRVPVRQGRGRRRRGHAPQDGERVGEAEVDRFTPVAFNEVGIGLTCGYEWGPAVGGDYEAPFAFNGTIVRAEVSAPDRSSAIRWPRWRPSWPRSDLRRRRVQPVCHGVPCSVHAL